jgi:hypothetical protein
MQGEGGEDELAVAELVDEHAADHDAEAEAGEAGSSDRTELRARESEVGGPRPEDPSSDSESDSGCEDGGESGP